MFTLSNLNAHNGVDHCMFQLAQPGQGLLCVMLKRAQAITKMCFNIQEIMLVTCLIDVLQVAIAVYFTSAQLCCDW